MAAVAGGHEQVHRRRTHQGRVEIAAEQVGLYIATHRIGGAQCIGRVRLGAVGAACGVALVAGELVRNSGRQEATGAAGRIQHALIGLGVQHPHHQLHGATGREVLAAVAAQVVADDLLG